MAENNKRKLKLPISNRITTLPKQSWLSRKNQEMLKKIDEFKRRFG